MDSAEQCVGQFLRWKGHTSVVFEPDGNIPPDFVVDGRIAVEVRRLIRYESTAGRPRSVSETAIPLEMKLTILLDAFGPPTSGQSWFVHISFERQAVPWKWKTLEPQVRLWLELFRDGRQTAGAENDFGNGVTIKLFRAQPRPRLFVLGGTSDQDAGDLVTEELEKSLRIVIQEKSDKIAEIRSASPYEEWWLVLTDHIGPGLDPVERANFVARLSIAHDWDKIVLVNPSNFEDSYEIQ